MSDITKNLLQKELQFYSKNKQEYLKTYKDQFVLIKGEKLIGSFTTEEEAYKAGVSRFGNEPFLIRKVAVEEQTASYSCFNCGRNQCRYLTISLLRLVKMVPNNLAQIF